MHAVGERSRHPDTDPTSMREFTALSGVVIALALLTCLFIVALPLLGSLSVAAAILTVFAGAGLATLFALSRW